MHGTRLLRTLVLFALVASMLAATAALGADSGDESSADAGRDQNATTRDVRTETRAYATVDGEPVRGYLARPRAERDSWPAVLLIHDRWGLNQHIRSLARRFAEAGYVALAVDLYADETATQLDRASRLEQTAASRPEAIRRNLQQAVYYLDLMPSTTRIGVVGWGVGGSRALDTAATLPQAIAASVLYYADTNGAPLDALQSPILALYASDDTRVPERQAQNLDQALKDLEKTHVIHVYPSAAHDFANPAGDAYSSDASARAWADTLAFLSRYLKGASQ